MPSCWSGSYVNMSDWFCRLTSSYVLVALRGCAKTRRTPCQSGVTSITQRTVSKNVSDCRCLPLSNILNEELIVPEHVDLATKMELSDFEYFLISRSSSVVATLSWKLKKWLLFSVQRKFSSSMISTTVIQFGSLTRAVSSKLSAMMTLWHGPRCWSGCTRVADCFC